MSKMYACLKHLLHGHISHKKNLHGLYRHLKWVIPDLPSADTQGRQEMCEVADSLTQNFGKKQVSFLYSRAKRSSAMGRPRLSCLWRCGNQPFVGSWAYFLQVEEQNFLSYYTQAWNKMRRKFGESRLAKPDLKRCAQPISGSSINGLSWACFLLLYCRLSYRLQP